MQERFDVDVDTVSHRDELDNHTGGAECEKRSPEVLETVGVIDVANIPKAIRDARDQKGENESNGRKAPSKNHASEEELASWYHRPADLHMK